MFRKSKLAAQSKKSDNNNSNNNNKSSNTIDTKSSISSIDSTSTNNSSSTPSTSVLKRIFGRKSKLMKASKSSESRDMFVNNNNETDPVATTTDPVVPIIREEVIVASTCVTSTLNSQSKSATTADNEVHLLNIPSTNRDRSRKSSDNDSAVDVNFHDEWSSENVDVQQRNKHSRRSDDTRSSQIIDEGNISCSRCSSSSATAQVEETKNYLAPNKVVINKIVRTESMTSWRKIKAALVWTPFIQHCARHQYPWIQIAGHQGNFKPGEQGTILKKHCGRESICLKMMRDDALCSFIPEFKSEVDYEGDKYICMQDLLAQFTKPSLMDVKMGTRTYLEEELVKAKECPKPRQDMYEKMIAVDKNEPTQDEHRQKAVLKPRYMIWRETLSSTFTMGFRVEGVKKVVGTQSRSFKKTKYRDEVKKVLTDFIDGKLEILTTFIVRLKSIEKQLMNSNFFWAHEFIGSSLLFVYDETQKANIWMIDFGKTVPLPPGITVDHYSDWCEGNHEDGYLFGLKKLLVILEEIQNELTVAIAAFSSSLAADTPVVVGDNDDVGSKESAEDGSGGCSNNDPPIK